MFLFAITKDGIANNFSSIDIQEYKKDNFIITSITDNLLSKRFTEWNGFSIVESPLVSFSSWKNILFSQLKYDENKRKLTIFNSTTSGNPIYYSLDSKGQFFCSTYISLLRTAGVPIEENTSVLPELFVYRYVMPPFTPYKNIYRLYTGGRLEVRQSGDKCIIQSVQPYTAPEPDLNIKSIKSSSKRTYDLLAASIEKLTPHKNEMTFLLSGGIDSSIMCKICQNKFSINTSYSTGFPFEDPFINVEKDYALSAAQALGTKHQYYEPTSDEYLVGLLECIKNNEEPVNHLQSVIYHLLLKNCLPLNKKIVISGQGAGATFGNLHNYLYWKDKMIIKILTKKPMRYLLISSSKINKKVKIFSNFLNESTLNYPLYNPKHPIWSERQFGSKQWVCDYFHVTEKEIIQKRYNFIEKVNDKSIYDSYALYAFSGYENNVLQEWTKIGAGDNRLLFCPYYDLDVLNYVFSIPWKLKLQSPQDVLRKEIARRANVPEFIIKRPKSSFGVHGKGWSEKGGIFEPLVPLASKVFNENEIRKMQSSDTKKAMTYWNMLNYSIWKRLCINNEPMDVLIEELNIEK